MKLRHVVAIIALAAGTFLAGCSATDEQPVAGQEAQGAATQDAEPAGPILSSKLLEAVYAAQLDKQTVTMTLEITAGSEISTASGSMEFSDGGFSADLTVDVPETGGDAPDQVRFIIVPNEGYLKFSSLPADKWLKLSADADDPLSQAFKPMFDEFAASADATQAYDAFGDFELTPEGTETVNGVTTTKYAGTVDIERALEGIDVPKKDELESMLAEGVTTVDIVLWVDRDDLIHKAVTSMPASGETVTVTATYSNWGEPVDIEVPDAGDVMSFSDLTSLG